MSKQNLATVSLDWLTANQGGRKRPIGTADYAATAYFTEENEQLFSVILRFPAKIECGLRLPTRTDVAAMDFLVTDRVAPQLEEGMRFHVTEGGRVVANGEILAVL
jgi:translation elongation factor EF-Tu-like GTPase